jgi:hypothetical protein
MPKKKNELKPWILKTPISKGPRTRQHQSYKSYDTAYQWTSEFDYSDFTSIWKTKGLMPIFYKLINVFLLLIQFNQPRDRYFFNQAITEILEKYNSNLDEEDHIDAAFVIQELQRTIIILYKELQLFPSAKPLLDEDLELYHGIDKNSIIYQTLLTLKKDTIYELPIFMSTSVTKDVACRFTAESRIIIKITVKKDDMPSFKYVYFGNTLIKGYDYFLTENEFLLNLYTKLKFINISNEVKIEYKTPNIGDTYGEHACRFTVINMEFVGNSNFTPEELNVNLDKYRITTEAELEKERELQAKQAQEAAELTGGRKYKINKRNQTHKTHKRNQTHKRKIRKKNLSIKYKFKPQKMLTKSRKNFKT